MVTWRANFEHGVATAPATSNIRTTMIDRCQQFQSNYFLVFYHFSRCLRGCSTPRNYATVNQTTTTHEFQQFRRWLRHPASWTEFTCTVLALTRMTRSHAHRRHRSIHWQTHPSCQYVCFQGRHRTNADSTFSSSTSSLVHTPTRRHSYSSTVQTMTPYR